jgi:hypothetical protein
VRVSILSVNAKGARCAWFVPHVEPTRVRRFWSDPRVRMKMLLPRITQAMEEQMKMNAMAKIRRTMTISCWKSDRL